MPHTVVGFFKSIDAADRVAGKLSAMGEQRILLVAEDTSSSAHRQLCSNGPVDRPLARTGMTEAEAAIFAKGIEQGGAVVMAVADEPQVDDVVRVMEEHGAIDLEEHEQPASSKRAQHREPVALPFNPNKPPLRERMGGVKTYVTVS